MKKVTPSQMKHWKDTRKAQQLRIEELKKDIRRIEGELRAALSKKVRCPNSKCRRPATVRAISENRCAKCPPAPQILEADI